MTKLLRILLVLTMPAILAASQWIEFLTSPVQPMIARAPIHDCSQHQCGCDPEKMKNGTCCCHAVADAPKPASPLELVFRAAQCAGGLLTPTGLANGKLEFIVSLFAAPPVMLASADLPEMRAAALSSRVVDPPTPPPKFLLVG